ncbi:MAG: glycosyltransferase [Aureibaculum sp.]
MSIIILLITIAYLILIGSFIIGFDRIKQFNLNDIEPETSFTVIIPFKNEAKNLPGLLKSLLNLNYPDNLFEVILVNNESDDDSVDIINNILDTKFSQENSDRTIIKILETERNTESPKKNAINKGVLIAKYDWIITTDADCIVPKYWLKSFDNFIQKNNTKLLVAPVCYFGIDTYLKRFQTLDFISLIGSTIGGFGIGKPFLCNGANMAYRKDLFVELKGFEGNMHISSGDDIFLLEKAIKQYPNDVHFLKTDLAIVKTKPQADLKSLISQRIRWAAKTSSYKNNFGKSTGLLVLIMNASIICCLLFAFIGILSPKFLGYIFVVKISIDFLLIYKTARFLDQEDYLSTYLLSSFIYPFFSVYIATLSIFSGYKWKGNYYKK